MTILYLTFYFDPDVGPGSFRNSSLVNELASQLQPSDLIHVITTQPNRYQSYRPAAATREERRQGGCPVTVERIAVPKHKSGFVDQIIAFWIYFWAAHRLSRYQSYDGIVASSSRLFTAFLGARLARKHQTRLFLDIRDLFREAILDLITWPIISTLLAAGLRLVERYTFGYASHINLVSQGFQPYFTSFPKATYSYFTNGIDPLFLDLSTGQSVANRPYKTVLYAGNIGEGQGLHTIIPQVAKALGQTHRFQVIGDGGAKAKLERALKVEPAPTVNICRPLSRPDLLTAYQQADYLLVHLNDWVACRRVLPSKLFEYGAMDKPILAGVAGYAAAFVREQLPNAFVFDPGDCSALVHILQNAPYQTQARGNFKQRFSRQTINRQMAQQIRSWMSAPAKSTQQPDESLQ